MVAGMVVGNEQPMGNLFPDGLRDTVTLVTHDNDTFSSELLLLDVLAVQQRTIDRAADLTE